jgi:hypothetical protein
MLAGYSGRWWVAGGWSIDLFLGRQTRPHGDIDIAVLRDEQHLLRAHLRDWDLQVAYEGGLSPWDGTWLEAPRHILWARPDATAPWTLEFLLEDRSGGEWSFRRDATVRLPLTNLGLTGASGVPYLRAEVSLLYKAKGADLDRNAADFKAVLPALDGEQRRWLCAALERAHPAHAWIERLTLPG